MSNCCTQRIIVPQICIRVPGPWRKASELAMRLEDGYRLEGEFLVTPDGFCLGFEAKPADQMFPSIFRMACRRDAHPSELSSLDKCQMIACTILPGGSGEFAKRILEVSASLVRAGGFGVFIDNCIRAHGAADWLELANNRHDANAVFYAFINMAKSSEEIFSHGMHVFGQRDAVIRHSSNLDDAIFSLEDFLRACAKDEVAAGKKDFQDRRGHQFRLQKEPHRHPFGNHHPVHNPYGRWRLKACE